jgi:hypothetical protein
LWRPCGEPQGGDLSGKITNLPPSGPTRIFTGEINRLEAELGAVKGNPEDRPGLLQESRA